MMDRKSYMQGAQHSYISYKFLYFSDLPINRETSYKFLYLEKSVIV